MLQKLKINNNYYPTKELKIVYTTSRLGNNAIVYTIERIRIDFDNLYIISKKIFEQLDNIYQNSNRRNNAKR